MSSTRHATDDSTLRQERWCSDPSFNDSINGMAAAKRISRVPDGRMRKLLWFIQLRSLQPNGIKDLAAELLQEFPDRIGTPASRRLDAKRKAPLTEAEFKELVDEWGPTDLAFDDWSLDFLLIDRPGPDKYEKQYHYAYQFLAQLDEAVKGLPVRLVRMCVDPEMAMEDGHAKERKYGQEAVAGVWYFTDLLGALCLLQEQHGERAAANVARTAISVEIEDNLDFCLGEQSWILIEGVSGLGKSNTIKGWCERHSGEVRYVEIPSSNDDRSFYAAIAESLGVARGNSYNLQQIKLRVEDMLKESGLLLALDQCHFLIPQYVRPNGTPSRLQWLMTAFDAGTPIAMVGLPEFSKWQKYYVEKAMWSDEQFEGRLNRKVRLAPSISDEDFFKIAQSHYPEGNEDAWNMLTGYALASGKKQARAIVAVLKSAHHEAKKAGREVIAFKDIKHAVKNIHLPSDNGYSGRDATVPPPAQNAGAAAAAPAGKAPRPKKPRKPRKPRAGALQRAGSRAAQPAQDLFDRPATEPDHAALALGRGRVTQPSAQAA